VEGAFAFLDLLGFSEYVKTDLVGAARLLESQRAILNTRLDDATVYVRNGTVLSDLANDHLVSSFDHFLPFSDSIFIASASPDQFVRQLATFLVAAFSFTGHVFACPEDPARPERVDTRCFAAAGVSKAQENWYPALWRGGLSFGRVELLGTHALANGGRIEMPMLVGVPVVEAVRFEKNSGEKGPRIFCGPTFKDHLSDTTVLPYIVPVPQKSCDEFLWPAFLFHDHDNALLELYQTHELLAPAINLWKAKRSTPVVDHYFQFVRLIARSATKWAECHGIAEAGREQVRSQIISFGGADLVELVFQ
jgi:hypothetical protein